MNDIDRQWERLKNNRRLTASRNAKVNETYERYLRNIYNTKTFRNDDNKQIRAFASGDRNEYQRLRDNLRDRQYSRNTYMGLNGG